MLKDARLRLSSIVVVFALVLIGRPLIGQENLNLAGMTSPVEIQFDGLPMSAGTGFFFQILGPPADPQKPAPQWRGITAVYLVTARHVVQPENWQRLKTLTFFLRKAGGNGGTDWVPISIDKNQLGRRLHLHTDSQVDVVAVDVLDLLVEKIKPAEGRPEPNILQWNAVNHEELPGVSKLKVSEGDDVIVVGYPRAFYDEFNKLPVLKRGMLASPWGIKYRGQDTFLIDCKLYHGSSGSPVISQPTHITYENGQIFQSPQKQFLFLGIYTGEPFLLGPLTDTDEERRQEKIKADMGMVWYPSTIEEVVKSPAMVH